MLNSAPAVPAAVLPKPVDAVPPTLSTADSGRIRIGAGWRLLAQ